MTGRKEKKVFVTPGPGDYEHEMKKSPTQIYDEKFREIKRATSRQPRYLEAMYRQKLREVNFFLKRFPSPSSDCNSIFFFSFFSKGFPGPSHYDPPKSTFEKYKKIDCKCDKYTLEPPPFCQTAEVIKKEKKE